MAQIRKYVFNDYFSLEVGAATKTSSFCFVLQVCPNRLSRGQGVFSPSHSSTTPPHPASPIQTSVIQSTKTYNGNKARNRRSSVEELNQQNNFSVNGSSGGDTVIRTAVYEEIDVEMEGTENAEKLSHHNAKVTSPGAQNGVRNGSNNHSEWDYIEESEDMGTPIFFDEIRVKKLT